MAGSEEGGKNRRHRKRENESAKCVRVKTKVREIFTELMHTGDLVDCTERSSRLYDVQPYLVQPYYSDYCTRAPATSDPGEVRLYRERASRERFVRFEFYYSCLSLFYIQLYIVARSALNWNT